MTRLFDFWCGDRGTAAAELALILPMAMAVMFGGFEAGNYLLTEHKVIKGVRDGSRYAARLPFEYFEGCGPDLTEPDAGLGLAEADDVEKNIENVTLTGRPSGGRIRVEGWDAATVDVWVSCQTTDTGLYEDLGSAPRVMVAARVPYPSILGTLGFDTGGVVLKAQSEAAVTGI